MCHPINAFRHVSNILIYRQLHYSLERQLKYSYSDFSGLRWRVKITCVYNFVTIWWLLGCSNHWVTRTEMVTYVYKARRFNYRGIDPSGWRTKVIWYAILILLLWYSPCILSNQVIEPNFHCTKYTIVAFTFHLTDLSLDSSVVRVSRRL